MFADIIKRMKRVGAKASNHRSIFEHTYKKCIPDIETKKRLPVNIELQQHIYDAGSVPFAVYS